MARAIPTVTDGRLTPGPGHAAIPIGDPAWDDWLAAPDSVSFHFAGPGGEFTARREQKAGGYYWYAYRRQGARVRKAYLGKAAGLTAERLSAAAASLAGPVSPSPPPATGAPAAPPMLAAKLFASRPPAAITARPALLARLDAAGPGGLTLISAPAGFGKTTVLAAWLARAAPPVAWLALDAADSDPARLLRYLVAAIRALAPAAGDAALAQLQAPQAPPQAALIALLNDLGALPAGAALVLDDYHTLHGTPAREALGFLVDHWPPHLRLLIASREDPPLPLARLRAQGRLTELRAADLRFSVAEAAVFLNDGMGLGLAAEDVAALDARTEGWIAGLQLAGLALRGRGDPAAFVRAFTGSNRFVLDYLVEEVLAGRPAHVQSFLLQTAILDRMCGALCDALLLPDEEGAPRPAAGEQAYSQTVLEELERANLFITPLDDARQWYRYHHLFGDVLRHRLLAGAPAEDVAALRRRAAAWHEQAGLVSEAVGYALAAGDYDHAERLIDRKMRVVQRSELQMALGWLAAFPADMVRARPRLLLTRAWLDAARGRFEDAAAGMAAADRLLAAPRPDSDADLPGWSAALAAFLAASAGDLPAAVTAAELALARLPAEDAGRRGAVGIFLGLALARAGDVAAATRAYTDVERLIRPPGGGHVAITANYNLALLHAAQGRLREAAATARRGLEIAEPELRWFLGLPHVALGAVLREWNDLDAAQTHLGRGIALLEPSGDVSAGVAYSELARLRLARGDREGAGAAMEAAAHIGRRADQPGTLALLELLNAEFALATGDLAAATRWAEAPPPAGLPPALRRRYPLTLARVRLAQRRPGDALTILAAARPALAAAGLNGALIELRALEALALHAGRDSVRALRPLELALTLAEPEGYLRVFLDEGAPMVAMLELARARGLAPAYTARLLAAFGPKPAPAGALREPLSERERDALRLLAAGLSGPEIAAALSVSPSTVKTHLKSIYGKLDAHSRAQAVDRAQTLGLV